MDENVEASKDIKVHYKAVNLQSLDSENEYNQRKRCTMSKKLKIGLIVVFSMIALSLCIILPIVLSRQKTKVDSYEETRYSLIVKSEITVTTGNSTLVIDDQSAVTLFSLDMEGSKYRLLAVNGSLEKEENSPSLGEVPLDIFMYFELDSRTGKILLAKYKKEALTEFTINLLSGITQHFVVDQDSEWDYSSECKEKYKNGSCSYNSKYMSGHKTVFEKNEFSDDGDTLEGFDFEHNSKTFIDHTGKVEKIEMKGIVLKKTSIGGYKQSYKFETDAHIEVISIEKMTKQEVNQLNLIAKDLPQVSFEKEVKMDDNIEYTYEFDEPDNETEDNGNSTARRLEGNNGGNERGLFEKKSKWEYQSLYGKKIYLESDFYTKKDSKNKYWFCGMHKFTYNDIEAKLLKKDFCVSSHDAKPAKTKEVSDLAVKITIKHDIGSINFAIFTIKIKAVSKVKTKVYKSTEGEGSHFSANLATFSTFTVESSGESKTSQGNIGVSLKAVMKSDLVDLMMGIKSPFYTALGASKSIEGSIECWVQNMPIKKGCYGFSTDYQICFTADSPASSSKTKVKSSIPYKKDELVIIFSSDI